MQITRMTASRWNPYFKKILHCLRLEKFHGWLGYVVIVEVQVWIRSLTLDRDGHVEHINGKNLFRLAVMSSSLKWFAHYRLMKISLVFYPHYIPYQVVSNSMVWLNDRLRQVLGHNENSGFMYGVSIYQKSSWWCRDQTAFLINELRTMVSSNATIEYSRTERLLLGGKHTMWKRFFLEREFVGVQVWVKHLTLDRDGHVEQQINGKDPYT